MQDALILHLAMRRPERFWGRSQDHTYHTKKFNIFNILRGLGPERGDEIQHVKGFGKSQVTKPLKMLNLRSLIGS